MEEPTREVAERELGTDNSIERDEAGSEARVEEPAKDVGERGVKLSKGAGREETKLGEMVGELPGRDKDR